MSEAKASGWLQSAVTKMDITCCDAFSSLSVVLRTFSALCTYSKFGHYPHPLGYHCVKFRFFCGLHYWGNPWRKIAYSVNHRIFYRRVCYRMLSLNNVHIRSLGIILVPYDNFVPNFISFTASIAELVHGEKLHSQSLNQSLIQLIWCTGNQSFRFGTL